MSSSASPEPLDLERDLPTTAEDVAALRALPAPRLSFEAYLRFLAWLGPAAPATLRKRPVPAGAPPFTLD